MESCPVAQWVQAPRKQDGGSKEGRKAGKQAEQGKGMESRKKILAPFTQSPSAHESCAAAQAGRFFLPRFSFVFSSWKISGGSTHQFQKTTDKPDSPKFSVFSNLKFLRAEERDTILKVKLKCEDKLLWSLLNSNSSYCSFRWHRRNLWHHSNESEFAAICVNVKTKH